MVKRILTVEWSSLPGATSKRRRLSLKEDNDGLYVCPVRKCLKPPYKSERGLRKHVNR